MKDLKALCDQVRQTAYDVHVDHAHGHLEKVYENVLAHRLRKAGIGVQQQHSIKVYDGVGTLVADYLANENEAQILGYLKSARMVHSLLINFVSYKFEIRKYAFILLLQLRRWWQGESLDFIGVLKDLFRRGSKCVGK